MLGTVADRLVENIECIEMDRRLVDLKRVVWTIESGAAYVSISCKVNFHPSFRESFLHTMEPIVLTSRDHSVIKTAV